MDNITNDFWDVLLWTFWIFIWVAAIFVWFRCVFDLFSDRGLSGWAKAGWAVVLIVLPWLGALIYLITRGRGMTERRMQDMRDRQHAQERYIQQVAGSSSPADDIASAQALLDAGTINQTEYDRLKAKALA